ncbi:MAG: hypothetical protein IJD80_00530, partial [Oscillospiraceae bacterium]|nr:hypothetical protein [Oscillospiraceae bacterium]
MINKIRNLTFTKILALSAVMVLLGHFVLGGLAMARDKSVQSQTLSVTDFKISSIIERKRDGEIKYVATDGDPQLLL